MDKPPTLTEEQITYLARDKWTALLAYWINLCVYYDQFEIKEPYTIPLRLAWENITPSQIDVSSSR